MSAMGSVSISSPSPARLRQTGDLAGVGELAQAHPAESELAEDRTRPAAAAAARVGADLELGLGSRLVDQCFLGHCCGSASRLLLPAGRSAATPRLGAGVGGLTERK